MILSRNVCAVSGSGSDSASSRVAGVPVVIRGGRPVETDLEHFQVKWIRFTVENASETKARADSTSVETDLALPV